MVKKKTKRKFFTKGRKEKIKKEIKKDLNINTYNKYLWVFETVLLVGVVEEYIEGYVVDLNIPFVFNVILVMLLIGTAFTLLIRFTEPLFKGILVWMVRFRNEKQVRFILHAGILFGLFCLYAFVYFDAIVVG